MRLVARCQAIVPRRVLRESRTHLSAEPKQDGCAFDPMAKLIMHSSIVLMSLFAASPAWACTLCHSDTAERVRAEVFGSDFWSNAAALSAVFPVLAVAVAMVRKMTP